MDERENRRNRTGDFALDEPLPLGATEPVDVVQVRADDSLISALISTDDLRIDDPIDERLVGLLRSWREDVQAEPERPLVDPATAMTALASASRAPRRRPNPFGPLTTAAAVLVIAFIGLGLAARGAEPGDPLWGVTKVLYTDKAKSVEAAVTVRSKLDQASEALDSGDVPAAMVALQEAKQKLPVVAAEDGRQELATKTEQLLIAVVLSTPPNTSSPAPSTTPPPATSASPLTTTTTAPPPSPSSTPSPSPSSTQPPPTSAQPSTPSPTSTGTGQAGTGEPPASAQPAATTPEASPKAGEGPPAASTNQPSAVATS